MAPFTPEVFTLCLLVTWSQAFLLDSELRIGSFNVKWFNPTKSRDHEILSTVSKVIQRYDVMLMMEIRDDAQQSAMTRLWAEVNKTFPYGLVMSKPLGRYPNFYTEQYAFFYRVGAGNVELKNTYQYNDSVNNEFEREPYSAHFQRPGQRSSLALIAAHIQPKNAPGEMDHMLEVYNAVKTTFNTEDVVILGDLNADCNYMSSSQLRNTPLRNDKLFKWVIPDDEDTTVSTHTSCAYDRIIVTKDIAYSKGGVFLFDTEYGMDFNSAYAVSDHYPVEVILSGF